MMDIKCKKMIREWIGRQTFADDEEKGPVTKAVIHQMTSAGKRGMEIGSVSLKQKPDSGTVNAIIADIDSMVSGDVEGTGQIQRYVLIAIHKSSEGYEQGAKLTIRVAPESDDEEGDMMSEGPTKTGLLAQQMRHTEVFARIAVSSAESTIRSLGRQLEESRAQVEKLLDKNFELTELMEDLMSKRHDRDLATKEAGFKMETRQELMHKLMLIAPILVNKLLAKDGKKLLKENTTAVEQLVHSIMVTIKPDQMEGLLATLTADQKMAFLSLYQAMEQFDMKPKEGETKQITDGANGKNGGKA